MSGGWEHTVISVSRVSKDYYLETLIDIFKDDHIVFFFFFKSYVN